MKNVLVVIMEVVLGALILVSMPNLAEAKIDTFSFDQVLFDENNKGGAADEMFVALNSVDGQLIVMAHGGAHGQFWLADNSKVVVDTVVSGLLQGGTIQAGQIKQIVIICCYPGAQPVATQAACGAPIIRCADVMTPVQTLVSYNSGKVLVRY